MSHPQASTGTGREQRGSSTASADQNMSQRVCQSCDATETSQWRYDVTGKILLCNGCGIRWRRTSGKERKKRIKPGPKRAGESPSSSSAAAELGGKSVLPSIRKCFTSSSSTTSNSLYNTPPGQYVDGIRRGRRTSPSCAKMDLKHLLCATSVGGAAGLGAGEEGRGSKERSRLPSRTRSAESSQIGIRIDDLVNDGEEMEPRRAKSEDGSFVLPASLRLGR